MSDTPQNTVRSLPKGLGNWVLTSTILFILGIALSSGDFYATWITLHPVLLNPVLALLVAASAGPFRGPFIRRVAVAHFVLTLAWVAALIVGASVRDATARQGWALHLPSLPQAVPITLASALAAHVVVAGAVWALASYLLAHPRRPHPRSTLVMAASALMAPVAWFGPTSDFSLITRWSLRETVEPSAPLSGVHVLFLRRSQDSSTDRWSIWHWDAATGMIRALALPDDARFANWTDRIDIVDGTESPLRLRVRYAVSSERKTRYSESDYAEAVLELPPLGPHPDLGWKVGRFSADRPRNTWEFVYADVRLHPTSPAPMRYPSLEHIYPPDRLRGGGLRAPFFYRSGWWMETIGMNPGRTSFLGSDFADCHLLDGEVIIGTFELHLLVIEGRNRTITDLGVGRCPVVLVAQE